MLTPAEKPRSGLGLPGTAGVQWPAAHVTRSKGDTCGCAESRDQGWETLGDWHHAAWLL